MTENVENQTLEKTSQETSNAEPTEAETSTAAQVIFQQTEESKVSEDKEDGTSDGGETDVIEEGKSEEKGDEADKDSDKTEESEEEKEFEAYKIEAPEGVEVDQSLMGTLEDFVNEHKIPKEASDKLVAKLMEDQKRAIDATFDAWGEAAKADKEIGGVKFEENKALAMKAVERFGGPELKTALNETGFGNHPAFVRAWRNVGKAMSNDGVFNKGEGNTEPKSAAQVIFGSVDKK